MFSEIIRYLSMLHDAEVTVCMLSLVFRTSHGVSVSEGAAMMNAKTAAAMGQEDAPIANFLSHKVSK